jgi:multiple sugar transport system ATP-binding protein
MKTLKIEELSKNFGTTEVLRKINLEIDEGNFLVLLGPSGCGKSTLLNIIAGLETINEGNVFIDDYNVSKVEPKDRNIAMVFQSYALYPSMNVKENMIFGLKQAKTSKEKIEEQLQKVSTFLQVDKLLERKPSQLSGGQRQRVAIGRALVREPRIFLFDEPLSNLDAKLRVEMRREIKKLHQQLKTTVVYVTHDQTEAMSLGTKIAIMNHGVIQQNDTPENIYNNSDVHTHHNRRYRLRFAQYHMEMSISNILRDKSFVDDLNKEQGIVSMRVGSALRSTEIKPLFPDLWRNAEMCII